MSQIRGTVSMVEPTSKPSAIRGGTTEIVGTGIIPGRVTIPGTADTGITLGTITVGGRLSFIRGIRVTRQCTAVRTTSAARIVGPIAGTLIRPTISTIVETAGDSPSVSNRWGEIPGDYRVNVLGSWRKE